MKMSILNDDRPCITLRNDITTLNELVLPVIADSKHIYIESFYYWNYRIFFKYLRYQNTHCAPHHYGP